jgi:hypothetical protein
MITHDYKSLPREKDGIRIILICDWLHEFLMDRRGLVAKCARRNKSACAWVAADVYVSPYDSLSNANNTKHAWVFVEARKKVFVRVNLLLPRTLVHGGA